MTGLLRTPLQRIRLGGILLASVFVLAVCGYHFFGGYGWVEAVWMVVVTISTVGYSESSASGPGMQLFRPVVPGRYSDG